MGTSKVYGAFSSVVSSTPVPSNPSSLSLVLSTSSSIKVTWTAVSGATGYELSYATSVDGVYTKLAIMTSTSASITSLTASTTYYVRVRAYRLVGTIKVYGGYSSIVYK